MDKSYILLILITYFLVLLGISFLTSRKADNDTFFTGNRNNKWYLVAFGMIGASLSGVTFISIPGVIGNSSFTYLQMAIGYIIGYAIIAFVLLPLYYRLNLTSIYEFLKQRFGHYTYKMGAGFFIISRLIGAALRMYLVVIVLQKFVFDDLGVPFEGTVAISILLIWVYTFKGGIKTIIWTDTLQTLFMLISVGLSIYFIADDLNLQLGQIFGAIDDAGIGEVFQTEDGLAKNYWIKGILGGMFITLGMTGVDQDMMQKNLTCKNEKEAKKNMISFSIVLFFVNILFVTLGGLLFLYMEANPDVADLWNSLGKDGVGQGDLLFATISLKGGLSGTVGVFFLLGLIAAAYSSADSALTSLTTSLSVDFLNIEKDEKKKQERKRRMAHVIMSVALLLTILIFKYANNDSVVWTLFAAASYTYGPLLGLFMFGIISKRQVSDYYSIPISIIIPTALFLFNWNIRTIFAVPEGEAFYEFGSEMLGINALLVFICLWIFSTYNVRNKEIY
jgi:SSS family solute:Na+ symporter